MRITQRQLRQIINEELGKWTDGNWYSNDSYKQYNDYKYYGNVKVSNTANKFDAWDKEWDKEYNYIPAQVVDDEPLDDWEMYEEICDIYGLDPNEDASWEQIEEYMVLNETDSIIDLYKLLMTYYE